jgi:hypothetical protein
MTKGIRKKAKATIGRWVEGTVQEFLELSDADMELIESKRLYR